MERLAGDIFTLGIDAMCAEVVRNMRANGVRTIVLKGPSFADWLYVDGTRRRYGDVDLLVSEAQRGDADAVLRELGFAPFTAGEHPLREPESGQPWVRDRDHAVVDMHVRLPGVGAPTPVVWAELSSETEEMRVGRMMVEILRPAARAMHVATHAAQHGTGASKPTEDLRRALAMLDDDDWHEAALVAERVLALPAFAAGLCHLPEGRELARRLALPEDIPTDVALRAGARTPLAVGFEAVARTPGLGAKLRLLGRLAIPSPSWMRARKALARRGVLGLVAAYLLRVPYLIVWSGPALVAWLRARRQSHHHRRPPHG